MSDSPSANSKINRTSSGNHLLKENKCHGVTGGGEIEVSVEEKRPWLVIKVRDTGPGLS